MSTVDDFYQATVTGSLYRCWLLFFRKACLDRTDTNGVSATTISVDANYRAIREAVFTKL